MKGFFGEIKKEKRSANKALNCSTCGLYKHAESARMSATGNMKKGILIVGSFPDKTEDENNLHWQGKIGRLLKRALRKQGIDLREDCLHINSINCAPYSKKINDKQIKSCFNMIVGKTIEKYQPKIILLLGSEAVKSVIGERWKKNLGGIEKWRGWTIPDKKYKTWICPTYHPQELLNAGKEKEIIWNQDLEHAISMLDEPFPRFNNTNIHYIQDLRELEKIKSSVIAFDYETTGLKPHALGHRIICASVAPNEEEVYTFMIPGNRRDQRPFLRLLQDNSISKMAHNMKFEKTWTEVRLRSPVNNLAFDSMLAAHVLDNRPEITGLKFQTYVNFGIADYDSEISTYLKAKDPKNSNSINRIEELIQTSEGKEKLLKYCALDSLYEYRLAMKQMKELNFNFLPF